MTEEEKIQELLKPRYLAISPNEKHYPGSFWKVGDIIDPVGKLTPFDDYPHLFKRLEWYEDRKPEEMPKYVKYAENGHVAKVNKWDLETTSAWFMYLEGGLHPYAPGGSALENTHWLPATLAEYQQYINSKQQP